MEEFYGVKAADDGQPWSEMSHIPITASVPYLKQMNREERERREKGRTCWHFEGKGRFFPFNS